MSLIDQLAEKQILAAMEKGDLDNLPGKGKPLVLEDDSMVPTHLRAGYRILKNAGFVPPELEQRREALQLVDLLGTLSENGKDDEAKRVLTDLQKLELKMRIQGIDTAYLYAHINKKLPA